MRKKENISRESFPSLSKNSSGGDTITLANSLELTSNFLASRGHCKMYLLMTFLAPPPATPHILVGREKNKGKFSSVQFSSVQSLSPARLFVTPWIAAHQASLSITSSRSLLKLMPIESVMPSSHLILCRPLLLLPPSPPSLRVKSMSNPFHGCILGWNCPVSLKL